jgi:3,4-dihydroxy 2-butanone 4-phosphate synthase
MAGRNTMGDANAAITAFRNGDPVCVFDSEFREGETDLLFSAESLNAEKIRQLRSECGGLLFLAIGHEVGEQFALPFLQDLHTDATLVKTNPVLAALITNDLQYDARSAFTLSLNHRDTFTGITDADRCLTARRFAELFGELYDSQSTVESSIAALGNEFRTPGHIPICRESEGGLTVREGHTELAVGLARLAGTLPVVMGAEMLQPDGDKALSVSDARIWAQERGIPFLSGDDIKTVLSAADK